jgi:DNA-binding CsgD family transcriptional regulator
MHSKVRSEVDVDAEEVAEIRRRLGELEQRLEALEGGALQSTAKAELSRLSETERRIVSHVAAGRTNEEVGERLFLSPKTVEWSLTKIYRKLRVRSRTELAAKLAGGIARQGNSRETPGESLSGSEPEVQDESRGGSPARDSSHFDHMEGR